MLSFGSRCSMKIEPDLEAAADGTRPRGQRGQRGQRCGRWPTAASLELRAYRLRPALTNLPPQSALSISTPISLCLSFYLSFYLS